MAAEVEEELTAEDVFAEIRRLKADARRIQEMTETAGDYHPALAELRGIGRLVDLQSRLVEKLGERHLTADGTREPSAAVLRAVCRHVAGNSRSPDAWAIAADWEPAGAFAASAVAADHPYDA